MKKLFSLLVFISCFTANAQTIVQPEEKPYIEVTGTAEKEVVPDIIYITITLREKVVNKETYTISQQDNKLKAALQAINIDLKNLSLADASTDIIKYKRRDKGTEGQKEYLLKVSTADQVNKVFEALHRIEVREAEVTGTDHSQMDALRKEVRINAIKAAKDKAIYLLQAIGEEPGKPLVVREEGVHAQNNYSNLRANVYMGEKKMTNAEETDFKTIRIQFSYYVKYSIK